MKVAIITDTHWGVRNDSSVFTEHFSKFYDDIFFPTLKDRGITTVLHLGDLVDRRKYINFATAKAMEEAFFQKLERDNITLHLSVGNHDTYYKNTNEVNGPVQLYGHSRYSNVNIYDGGPVELILDGCKIMLSPWICPENYSETMNAIKNTDSQILMGHFEIEGFEMMKGQLCNHGLSSELFKKFDIVYSGHFHHPSSYGNISYLGAPYEMTWTDYQGKRGFHIFDTSNRRLEFVQNPYTVFEKIIYDDKEDPLTLEDIEDIEATSLTNKFVKVIVKNKDNPYIFDMFVEKLHASNPADLKIVEDGLILEELSDGEEVIDETQDTLTILKGYVENIDFANKKRVEDYLRELYQEAMNQ